MSKPFAAVLMGSDSGLPVMRATLDILKSLEIPYELRITSAHRTPQVTDAYVMDAGPLQGMDSLLSTVMMPGGIPVATLAVGKAGAKNAG